jgi:hypothetical protein
VATNIASGLAVTAFETVAVSASVASTLDLDTVSGFTAATGLQVDNNGAANTLLTLDDVADGVALNVVGAGTNTATQTFNDVTFTLKDTTGTTANSNAESLVVNVNNAGTATGAANDGSLGDLTIGGVETITMNFADFSDADTDDVAIAAAETLTVTGSTDVTFGGTNTFTNLETLSAGTMTGDFNIGTLTGAVGALAATFGAGVDTASNGTATGAQTFTMGAGNDVFTVAEVTNTTITVNMGDGDDSITASAGDDAGDTVNINGGDGTDILTSAGDASIDSLSNVEQIRVTGTNALNIDTATGYADTIEIFELSGGTADVTFTTASAGNTVSLANLTFAGWTSGTDLMKITGTTGAETITGSSVVDTIDAGAGADSISGGAGADIILINDNDSGLGTITTPSIATGTMDVIAGVAGDIINLGGALDTENDYDIFDNHVAGAAMDTTIITNQVAEYTGVYEASTNTFTSSATAAAATASNTDVDAVAYLYANTDDADTIATEGIIITGVGTQTDGAITNGVITLA